MENSLVKFVRPSKKIIHLPIDTKFPIGFMNSLIDQAKSGRKNIALYFFDGTDLVLAGPPYQAGQQKTGFEVQSVIDSVNVTRTALKLFIGGQLVGVFTDSQFYVEQVNGIPGFPQDANDTQVPKRQLYKKGFNPIATDFKYLGIAESAENLIDAGGTKFNTTSFMSAVGATQTTGKLSVKNQSGLAVGVGDIEYGILKVNSGTNQLELEAQQANTDINLKVRKGNAYISGIVIDAATERVGVFTDNPTVELDVTGAGKFSGNVTVGGNFTVGGNLISDDITTATLTTSGNLTVTGNLSVNGTTTTVNSTTVNIADPVFEIGSDSSDDNLDRGIKFKYNDSGAKLGFFGLDDSTGKFIAVKAATDSSSVFSGTAMDAVFGGIEGSTLAMSGSITSYAGAAPTDGKLLIGDTASGLFDAATLTAGDGIDITNGAGAITIAAEVSTASNLGSVIVAAGEGMDVSYSGGTATVAGEDATTSNKGVASFASANFTVSSGAVSITALDGGTF